MRRIVVTGGPGAGKTTLLAEFARRGFATVGDSARAVIAERLARGEAPRPDPESFAREILRRDIERYRAVPEHADLAFFDRSVVDALGMLDAAVPLPAEELEAHLQTFPFVKMVFVLPPWEAIYRTDRERDHAFDHAVRVHADIVRWYRQCGYETAEAARGPVAQRADRILQQLAAQRPSAAW